MERLHLEVADRQIEPVVERPRRQDQRIDRRRPAVYSDLDGVPTLGQALICQLAGNHLAVRERLRAGHMVEVPVAEQDGDALDSLPLKRLADEPPAIDGDVGVVDERLVPVDDRVAGDAERQGALIDPVRLGGEAMALLAALVEGEDSLGWAKDADVLHGAALRRP